MKYTWWFLLLLLPGILFAAEPIDKHREWDAGYSQKIREYTTGPEFMTDLVDHLPASTTVPSPEKFLGYVAGAPDKLTYAEDVYRYMRALEAASPRVKTYSIGKSEEGREMILVVIADEQTIQKLDRYKEITRSLADPRKLTDETAAALIQEGKPFYYVTGAMHSPETGSPEMLMEMAYRLAVEDTPFIQDIRKNVITMITPVLEVDGRDRMVDLSRWYLAHPDAGMPPFTYWGHYVAHDNNRDAIGLGLALSRNILKTYFEWHPMVVHDLHESIPFLYISTGTGPYNAWLDPIAIDEWQRMAYNEVQALTQKGLVGVWTQGFYDGWAPNYMFWVAHGHNSIGRFYETYGNSVPTTQDRVVRGASQRDWYRPNPPYPKVKWSLRNNVNYQQSGILTALHYAADNRQHLLETFWTLGKRSIAKATTEGPAAYVFTADQKRLGQLRDLLNLLRAQGIEVQQTDQAFTTKLTWPPKPKDEKKEEPPAAPAEKKPAKTTEDKNAKGKEEKKDPDEVSFPAGSFIVRMDQPYSRFADALLDTQFVLGKERVYDDTGWTLGYTKNVEFKRLVNQDVLKVPMHPWDGALKPAAAAAKGAAMAIHNTADTDLVRLVYALPDVKISVLDEELKLKSSALPAGTIVMPLNDQTQRAVAAGNLQFDALDAMPSLKMHDLARPRIAILHTWLDTQDEGWFRIAFDELKVPYDYISTQDIAVMPDLRSKYDVIVFPPAGGEPVDVVNGMPPGPPLPWKKTELTPNLGVDETDDMRPGLGLGGLMNLKKFAETGGLIIAVKESARLMVEYGLAQYIQMVEPQDLKARGTILQAAVTDKKSPVVFGYDDAIPVHYTGQEIFKVGAFDLSPRFSLGGTDRPSGRGSKTDPDVPQGRPFVETPEKPKPGPGEEGFMLPDDFAIYLQPYLPKVEDRPRVILSFPKEADKILLSGMLEGESEIAGKAVVIDSPLGKGHILLFANNPMWRNNTQGTYALVFNAIFNYQNLSLGWPPAAK